MNEVQNKVPGKPRKYTPGGIRRKVAALMAGALMTAVLALLVIVPTTVSAQTSTDATLSSLNVYPKNINGFRSNTNTYEVGVDPTVGYATIEVETNHADATVKITPPDFDGYAANDHQVRLSPGRNAVTITVTAENGNDTETYTVNVNQGVTNDYGWKAGSDLDGLIAAGNETPQGITSDGTTIWILDNNDRKIYAYSKYDGSRDPSKDFTNLVSSGNSHPIGIFTDGSTMWVTDAQDDKIYAYEATGDHSRFSNRDFNSLGSAGNGKPRGLWSDGSIMWLSTGTERSTPTGCQTNKGSPARNSTPYQTRGTHYPAEYGRTERPCGLPTPRMRNSTPTASRIRRDGPHEISTHSQPHGLPPSSRYGQTARPCG